MVVHTLLISGRSFFGLEGLAALSPGDGMKCCEIGLERLGLGYIMFRFLLHDEELHLSGAAVANGGGSRRHGNRRLPHDRGKERCKVGSLQIALRIGVQRVHSLGVLRGITPLFVALEHVAVHGFRVAPKSSGSAAGGICCCVS